MELDTNNVGSSLAELLKRKAGGDTPLQRSNSSPELISIPFILSFSHLTYSLPRKMLRTSSRAESTNTLLNDISGEARNGEILALLGPSGSGKTTLLDALANRIDSKSLKGRVILNGETLEPGLLREISAYVMQEDVLFPMLTVKETLMFSAEFKLPDSLSKSNKKARVEALIVQLGLRTAAETVIGDHGHRGISGGERRRVLIGMEIINDPILLFLDEPTTGLDSTSAFMVVKVLKQIAQGGSIVILAIHQPGYRIDKLFDKVLFLSSGQTVFRGPPTSLPCFFAEFGHPIPENENHIEFALDLIHELKASPGGTTRLVEFNTHWQNKHKLKPDFKPLPLSLKEKLRLESRSNHSICSEIMILSRRSILNSKRMPEVIGMRIGAALFSGFILSTIYWKLDSSPKGVQERFACTSIAIATTFYICATAFPKFIQERSILMREGASNMYSKSSYLLSHTIIALSSIFFLSLAFATTIFWAVGLSGGISGFLFFLAAIFASFWAGNACVTFLCGVVPKGMAGSTIVLNLIGLFYLFCGFAINPNQMPRYWIWLHYISPIKYPYEAVLLNEFGDPTKCFVRGSHIFEDSPLEDASATTKTTLLKTLSSFLNTNLTGTSCITPGSYILRQKGITGLSKWDSLWITIAWGFFFRILFYLTMFLGTNKRK